MATAAPTTAPHDSNGAGNPSCWCRFLTWLSKSHTGPHKAESGFTRLFFPAFLGGSPANSRYAYTAISPALNPRMKISLGRKDSPCRGFLLQVLLIFSAGLLPIFRIPFCEAFSLFTPPQIFALLTNCAQERDYAVWNGREQGKKTPFGVRRKLVSSFLSLMRLRKGGSGLPLPLFLAGKAWPNCSPIFALQMFLRSRSAVCAALFGTAGFPIHQYPPGSLSKNNLRSMCLVWHFPMHSVLTGQISQSAFFE